MSHETPLNVSLISPECLCNVTGMSPDCIVTLHLATLHFSNCICHIAFVTFICLITFVTLNFSPCICHAEFENLNLNV